MWEKEKKGVGECAAKEQKTFHFSVSLITTAYTTADLPSQQVHPALSIHHCTCASNVRLYARTLFPFLAVSPHSAETDI